jgi:hypothetical protein
MAIDRKLSPTHEAPYRGLRVLDFGQASPRPIAPACMPPISLPNESSIPGNG